jgi:N-formylglutamate amidohydrolase
MHADEAGKSFFTSYVGEEEVAASPPEPELDPPFDVLEPEELRCPLVFSSPHSGNVYPARFLHAAKLDALTLRRSEDAYVDELFAGVVTLGAPLLRARFPRAYLDVNREPYELDPRMFDGRLPTYANTRSTRVAGGLGTIARVVGEAQEIYARRLPVGEAIRRIEGLYKPYHRNLRRLLQCAGTRFGVAVLVDCHSMPSASAGPGQSGFPDRLKTDFVLGDRYGTSCQSNLVDIVEYELRRRGYAVQRNKPYAGGFITERYGQPGAGCHALQIEVNRSLYMDETQLSRGPRFEELAHVLRAVAASLAAVLCDGLPGQRAAAE